MRLSFHVCRSSHVPFFAGKPLFGTLIALLYKGRPVVGIIDQPVLRERWLGVQGRPTTLNGVGGGLCVQMHVCVCVMPVYMPVYMHVYMHVCV